MNTQALTIRELINQTNNTNYETIEELKNANKELIFSEAYNDKNIDLKSNDITLLYVDFNATQLAQRCSLPASSLSDKILKGLNGFIYNDKDINIYELSRYLRDKKIETISVKEFRECIAETIITYRISVNENNFINDNKIVKIKRMKNNKISKIDDYIFILDNFEIVSGEEAKQYFIKALNIESGKKYRFDVVESK